MANLHEYLYRIRRTTAGEVAYRARRAMLAVRLKRTLLAGQSPVVVPLFDREWVRRLSPPQFEFQFNFKEAGDGQTRENFRSVTLNTPLLDIHAVEEASCRPFSVEAGPRRNGVDIRTIWEPARLQHLVPFLLEDNEKAIEAQRYVAVSEVVQWIYDNPFLFGPHYMSPMECGLRIPVLFYCLKAMENGTVQDEKIVATSLYLHSWWIYRNLSLYNSLGNHTVCECIGLIHSGAVFRDTLEGKRWLATGCRLLEQELPHQILSDGGPAEQSTAYQRFVVDLYWMAFNFLETNHLHDCRGWLERLEAAETFLSAFATAADRYVPIGDSDDGCAVGPGIQPKRVVNQSPILTVQTFEESGYTVIRDNGLLLTFDHGPLGMAPLYNHGHADALSITLTYKGQPVFIDPGTYRYNGEPQWRRYFKGTRAHNTVIVDGMDQANQASGFIWTQPYESRVVDRVEKKGGFSIEAQHNGYCRLGDPVRHFRRVSYLVDDAVYIQDRFSGHGSHTFELNFHIGEAWSIDRMDGWWHLDFKEFVVLFTVRENMDTALASGRMEPPFGWNAPRYGEKQPSHVVTYQRSARPPDVRFTTVIFFRDK